MHRFPRGCQHTHKCIFRGAHCRYYWRPALSLSQHLNLQAESVMVEMPGNGVAQAALSPNVAAPRSVQQGVLPTHSTPRMCLGSGCGAVDMCNCPACLHPFMCASTPLQPCPAPSPGLTRKVATLVLECLLCVLRSPAAVDPAHRPALRAVLLAFRGEDEDSEEEEMEEGGAAAAWLHLLLISCKNSVTVHCMCSGLKPEAAWVMGGV